MMAAFPGTVYVVISQQLPLYRELLFVSMAPFQKCRKHIRRKVLKPNIRWDLGKCKYVHTFRLIPSFITFLCQEMEMQQKSNEF